jgi:hypothetical protein
MLAQRADRHTAESSIMRSIETDDTNMARSSIMQSIEADDTNMAEGPIPEPSERLATAMNTLGAAAEQVEVAESVTRLHAIVREVVLRTYSSSEKGSTCDNDQSTTGESQAATSTADTQKETLDEE